MQFIISIIIFLGQTKFCTYTSFAGQLGIEWTTVCMCDNSPLNDKLYTMGYMA